MNGITYVANFLEHHFKLFNSLMNSITWDARMKARKTASFGKAYNYSQINYPYQEFTEELNEIVEAINNKLCFRPNNCLINLYEDGSSTMGFHSDRTDILFENTGVAIVSLGATRTLRFRNIDDSQDTIDFDLPAGSLIYMNNLIQETWQHAIPELNIASGRMSLTFRKLR